MRGFLRSMVKLKNYLNALLSMPEDYLDDDENIFIRNKNTFSDSLDDED